MSARHQDVAIVGMSCRFPGGATLRELWRTIRGGVAHARPLDDARFPHALFCEGAASETTYARHMARVEGLGARAQIAGWTGEPYGLTPRRASVLDPQQALLLEVAREAIEDAGYAARAFDREDTGVFVGASAVEHRSLAVGRLFARQLFHGAFGAASPRDPAWEAAAMAELPEIQAYSMVGNLGSFLASGLAQAFDLGGPAHTVDAACASGLAALHTAVLALRAGACSMALVGGVYLACLPDNLVAFARIGALSRAGACRPFDAAADGFVLGEGAGVVVLKPLPRARADGDRVHAVVRGVGASSDGRSEGPMTPSEEGQRRALVRAYRDAAVDPATVGYFEAHGTATTAGDLAEVRALRALGPGRAALGSVKANIGHAMSAAGLAGLIKAALVVARGEIPPLAGLETPRAELDLASSGLRLPRAPEPFIAAADHPRRAGVSAFGFGGTNVHAVVEEAPA